MGNKIKLLFICGRNTARSQIAEAFLNSIGGDVFEAESAGLEPGAGVNPLAANVMKEVDIDISANTVDSIMDFFREGRSYDYVIAVCDEARAGTCPNFPGSHERLHWPFDDIGAFDGERDEMMGKARIVRDGIRAAVERFVAERRRG